LHEFKLNVNVNLEFPEKLTREDSIFFIAFVGGGVAPDKASENYK